MIKRFSSCLAALIIVLTSICSVFTAFAQNADDGARKFNVVFVVDASGSMLNADPEGWRYEAIEQFLGLLSNQGNSVATVVFDEEVKSSTPLKNITSNSDKTNISNTLKNATVEYDGDTNIGAALEKANEIIAGGEEKSSIIMLLSDGNTDISSKYGGQNAERISIEKKNNAIAKARENGTQIYCIGLDANGKVDATELNEIAFNTNGKCTIVSNADDLKNVLQEFYKIIYGTAGTQEVLNLPVVKEFTVPDTGVEEINVLIEGQPTSIKLTQPSGMEISNTALGEMMFKGKNFTNIKLEKPVMSGNWKLELGGDPNSQVIINLIPNLNLSITASLESAASSYKRNENISITAKLSTDGTDVTDAAVYQKYPAKLTVTSANDTSFRKEYSAVAFDGHYKTDVSFDAIGTYYITASVNIGYGDIPGNTISVTVGNSVPVPVKDDVKINEYCFSIGNKAYAYDLNEYVKDEDAETLSFMLEKPTFDSSEYSLAADGIVNITPSEEKEGSFSVIATDASGASCAFTLTVAYKNILIPVIIGAVALIVIVAVIIILVNYKKTHKPYGGTITVTAFDNDNGDISAPMTDMPSARPYDICMINCDSDAIGGIRGTFYGAGMNKGYCIFKPKGTAFYNGRKAGTVKIYEGTETVTSRLDGAKGVEITFTASESDF